MGRHGKNLLKGKAPEDKARTVMSRTGPVDMDRMLTAYEKTLLSEAAKQDFVKKTTDTVMAACSGILLYHYRDLAVCPPDERLRLFYSLVDRFIHERLENPDERQQFAEWYWSACTGNELVRVEHQKEYKMAKKYSQELSIALKNRIDAQGYDHSDVCPACGFSRATYYSLIGGGNYSKKAFDAAADFVGLEMDDDLKAMYKERFGVGNSNRTERMEAMAVEIEKEAPIVVEREQEPEAEKVCETPAPEAEKMDAPAQISADEPEKVPVKEDTVAPEAEAEAEQLPYSDVNEMYKEAKPVTVPDDYDDRVLTPDCLMANIENYANELPALKDALAELQKRIDEMQKQAASMAKFIRVIEAYNSL